MPPARSLGEIPTIQPAIADPTSGMTTGVAPDMTAAMMANLLPITTLPSATKSSGIYIGEGIPPVPEKLAGKIRRWEFVDMAELLPELWGSSPAKSDEVSGSQQPATGRKKRKISDIWMWLQSYALYVGVMAGQHPEAVPELMAYLVNILRASQDFTGLAWLTYDAAFRRQAAITGNRQWSRLNPTLYNICFVEKAWATSRCELCMDLHHKTNECALVSEADPDVATRLKAIESAVLLMSASSQGGSSQQPSLLTPSPICRLWNEKRCYFRRCKYRHACRAAAAAVQLWSAVSRVYQPVEPRQRPCLVQLWHGPQVYPHCRGSGRARTTSTKRTIPLAHV